MPNIISTHISALYFCLILAIGLLGGSACRRGDSRATMLMDRAESLMEQRPDSALSTLDSITPAALAPGEQTARYALLRSMALDKNYIDTTDFSVLQPAIDYYLTKGTPDQKLRTYYYQGRIYQNAGNDDSAMQAFMNANDIKEEITDSLTLARLLIAQGSLYFKQYKIEQYIDNNLKAAEIYGQKDKHKQQIKSYAKAISGNLILKKQQSTDSLLLVCSELINRFPEYGNYLTPVKMTYTILFGSKNEIKAMLPSFNAETASLDIKLNLARGYTEIGDGESALECLKNVKLPPSAVDSIKFLSIKSSALKRIGEYEKALTINEKISNIMNDFHYDLITHELLFVEDKHKLEMKSLMENQKSERLILICLSCILVLIIIIGIIYYRYRIGRDKRIIAEHENARLRLEDESLRKEQENLRLEKEAAELAAQNLQLEIGQLEEEQANLKNILQRQIELDKPLKEVIKLRLDMLNSLLAKEISENDIYAQPYNKWIESIRNDKIEFMNSTRLAFTASHPAFIEYLKAHNLTTDEINHLCLYALGLRGKEIGEYMQQKRHYHLISDIRKKLGIDGHQTNIGIYIRQLMEQL